MILQYFLTEARGLKGDQPPDHVLFMTRASYFKAIWVVGFQLCVAYKMKMKVNIHFWNIQYRIGILLKY